eukprot:CAMPEP_0171043160 /NCGR_PEP_ID=MMETSP0736-20130129/46823_1 /TAXON_ID=186038 /ORGANISM="Fragilariopsis kerguelensis, Strain L26-C5" /LENGTH=53 /DNA_ID=CAMNT_0011492055 /DNA_START=25 /DNA_END=183 /DNA_ORIENTATION=+
MNTTDGKMIFFQFPSEPIDFLSCIAKDDRLGDRHGIIQITQRIKFPFFFGNID